MSKFVSLYYFDLADVFVCISIVQTYVYIDTFVYFLPV